MMNFSSLNEAREYVREMPIDATVAIGDARVVRYAAGDVEILEDGEQPSESGSIDIGAVREVLY